LDVAAEQAVHSQRADPHVCSSGHYLIWHLSDALQRPVYDRL